MVKKLKLKLILSTGVSHYRTHLISQLEKRLETIGNFGDVLA